MKEYALFAEFEIDGWDMRIEPYSVGYYGVGIVKCVGGVPHSYAVSLPGVDSPRDALKAARPALLAWTSRWEELALRCGSVFLRAAILEKRP